MKRRSTSIELTVYIYKVNFGNNEYSIKQNTSVYSTIKKINDNIVIWAKLNVSYKRSPTFRLETIYIFHIEEYDHLQEASFLEDGF